MEISSFYIEFSILEQHDALTRKIGFRWLCLLNKFWRPNLHKLYIFNPLPPTSAKRHLKILLCFRPDDFTRQWGTP